MAAITHTRTKCDLHIKEFVFASLLVRSFLPSLLHLGGDPGGLPSSGPGPEGDQTPDPWDDWGLWSLLKTVNLFQGVVNFLSFLHLLVTSLAAFYGICVAARQYVYGEEEEPEEEGEDLPDEKQLKSSVPPKRQYELTPD